VDKNSRNKLLEMYGIIGETYGTKEAQILASLIEWNEKLAELEEAFTAAWKDGRNCGIDLDLLRQHWRNGIRQCKAQEGGAG
jgi:hypothetical protein